MDRVREPPDRDIVRTSLQRDGRQGTGEGVMAIADAGHDEIGAELLREHAADHDAVDADVKGDGCVGVAKVLAPSR